MAAIIAEPIIAVVTAIVGAVVEKGTEAAVMASLSAAVTSAIEAAVSAAITAAIASAVASVVSGNITARTTIAVEEALENGLNKAVKDVIGSQGVKDISRAITAIPSDEVIDKLAKVAIDAINPHLWVFQDPVFFRLTKLIKALRTIKNGRKPEDDDDDDDDCDEEKCRYFRGPPPSDDAEDFIFFSVFGSAECKEGDEVFSMSAQWKKLESLIDDPIGGHYVNQLFQELFDTCADEEEETDFSLLDSVQSFLVGAKQPKPKQKPKIPNHVKVDYGNLVYFGNQQIYNIKGSSVDKRKPSWLKAYLKLGYGQCDKCYIALENPVCGHTQPLQGNIVGGHMWSPELKKADKSALYYILPICKMHNKRNAYDMPLSDGTGWLKTTKDSFALQIKSVDKVPGWKGKYQSLVGAKYLLLLATEVDGDADECSVITKPKHLTDWLVEEAHKIALEFAKDPIDIVFKEVSGIVLGKLNEIIEQAGNDALKWTKSEGNDIMLQSLIPFYGMYQAIKRLSSLQSDAIGKFHSGAQSALTDYKNTCLGQTEQARRKQRLNDETDKVIASKAWQDRIETFEGTVASKVSTLVTP